MTASRPFPDLRALTQHAFNEPFLVNLLNQNDVSENGSKFIQSLIEARPEDRPTASIALGNHWLIETSIINVEADHEERRECERSGGEEIKKIEENMSLIQVSDDSYKKLEELMLNEPSASDGTSFCYHAYCTYLG